MYLFIQLCVSWLFVHTVLTLEENKVSLSISWHGFSFLAKMPNKISAKTAFQRLWKLLHFLKWLGKSKPENIDASVWIPTWVHSRILLAYSVPGVGTFVCASPSTASPLICRAAATPKSRDSLFICPKAHLKALHHLQLWAWLNHLYSPGPACIRARSWGCSHCQPSSDGQGHKGRKKGSGKCVVHWGYCLLKTLTHGEFPMKAEKTVEPHDHIIL